MTTAPTTPTMPTHHATSPTPEPIFFSSPYPEYPPISPTPIRRSDISIRVDPAENLRRNSDILHHDAIKFRSRFIERSHEYDMELIRRQQAMIAVQPKTSTEEIEEKRRLLQIKVENRRRSEAAAGKSANVLGTIDPNNRSPSPSKQKPIPNPKNPVGTKPHGSPLKGPKNATQASKVSKNIVTTKPVTNTKDKK